MVAPPIVVEAFRSLIVNHIWQWSRIHLLHEGSELLVVHHHYRSRRTRLHMILRLALPHHRLNSTIGSISCYHDGYYALLRRGRSKISWNKIIPLQISLPGAPSCYHQSLRVTCTWLASEVYLHKSPRSEKVGGSPVGNPLMPKLGNQWYK